MTFEAARAREYYERAWAALPAADARRLFAAEIMGRTYFALLRAIEARRFQVFGGGSASDPSPYRDRALLLARTRWRGGGRGRGARDASSRWGPP